MIRTSFDAITTRESWIDIVEILDEDDLSPIDISSWKIQVEIRRQDHPGLPMDYGWPSHNFSWGSGVALATTDNGTVTITDIGVFEFIFSQATIASLCPAVYVVGCTMSRDGEAVQLLLGLLPVLDGVVPQ